MTSHSPLKRAFTLFSPNRQQIVGFILILGIGLSGTFSVSSAYAQNSTKASSGQATESAHWKTAFDHQVAQQLRQTPSQRSSLLRVLIEVASEKEDVGLSQTVDAVLHVIENDPCSEHRLMAVQALTTIGPEHIAAEQYQGAMARLYALMQEETSEQVRSGAAQLLAQRAG